MSVTEPSYVFKRRNGYQRAGRRIALRASLRPQLELWLGLDLVIIHTYLPLKMEQSVPKRQHIKFRRRGITQKKAHNIETDNNG